MQPIYYLMSTYFKNLTDESNSDISSVALLWNNAKVLALLKVKREIH